MGTTTAVKNRNFKVDGQNYKAIFLGDDQWSITGPDADMLVSADADTPNEVLAAEVDFALLLDY